MVKEAQKCPSCILVGEACTIICCERNEGHKGNHREHLESTDEESQEHVSVVVEWTAQDDDKLTQVIAELIRARLPEDAEDFPSQVIAEYLTRC